MLKVFLAVMVTAFVTSGAAMAVSSLWHANGVVCQPGGGGVVCVQSTGKGYGVGISRKAVVIVRISDGKTIAARRQP